MTDPVRLVRNDAILEITLDRPKANSIDDATSRRLGEAFCEFRDDPALRVAILTGGGERFFSAGWDLKAAAAGEAGLDYGVGGFAGLTELWDLDARNVISGAFDRIRGVGRAYRWNCLRFIDDCRGGVCRTVGDVFGAWNSRPHPHDQHRSPEFIGNLQRIFAGRGFKVPLPRRIV